MKKKQNPTPPTHGDDPILTPSAVGRVIGMSRQTVTRWVHEKMFRPEDIVRKPNNLLGIRLSAVRRHLSGTGMAIDPARLKEEVRLDAEAAAAAARTAEITRRHKAEQAAKAAKAAARMAGGVK